MVISTISIGRTYIMLSRISIYMSFYKNIPPKKEPVYLNQLKGDPDFLGFVETRDMVQRIVNDDTYTCGLYLHNGNTVQNVIKAI